MYVSNFGLQYVGEPRRQLRFKINEHKSAIRRADPETAAAAHFADGSHSVSDLAFRGIDMMIHNCHGGNMEQILLLSECRYFSSILPYPP